MYIKTFNYTKTEGKTSKRVLAVLTSPNTMFEGVDITPLNVEEQANYANELDDLRNAYLEAVAKISDKYELRNQYRRFDPKKMTDIVDENI